MNYAKLKPWQKTEALEECVLRGTPTEVAKAFREMGELRFTARALGLACRYRGLDMVKTLVEGGASFSYDLSLVRLLYRKADVVPISGDNENYSLALASSVKTPYMHTVVKIGKQFGLELIPLRARLFILEYLCKNSERIGFKPDEFLFFAHFSEEWDMISALKKKGFAVSKSKIEVMTAGGGDNWFDYCFLVNQLDDEQFFRVMNALAAECGGKKLHFTEFFWDMNYERLPQSKFIKFLLDNFNQSKMNKGRLMKGFIDSGNVSCLELAAENGWLKMPKKRDEMILYATENGKTECAAWLLDFKNRTADLAAERAKAEKKLVREFNANPNSVTELKKNWSFTKKNDGTLVITGYKGSSTVLNVPQKIGNAAVTEIGDWALSPHASRIKEPTREFRKTITKITLPEGLKKIGESAFDDLVSLESVNIPKTVRSIGEYAFRDCSSLKTVIVPNGVKDIDANAFSMLHSIGSLEYVELPSTLKYFREDCKWWRVYLFHSANCPKLVVGVPHAPHVEEFCEHNEIKFRYYDE